MISVLFVCLGNICRSPMAEAVFRKLVDERNLSELISVDSAGTGNWHAGQAPHEGTRVLLDEKKIDYTGIKARQVIEADVTEFNYVIAMDAENLGNLHRLAGMKDAGYIARLLDFYPESKRNDVPDPYYTGDFDEVYSLIRTGCERLLDFIVNRESLQNKQT